MVHIQVAVVEAAGHHHPPYEALQRAQQKEDDKGADHLPVEVVAHEKVYKPYQEDDAQHARPKAVQPLPKEEAFKVGEAIAAVHVFELAYLFVAIKGVVPMFGIERWQYPEDGVPLGDGEARAGEAGDTAQQRLDDDHDDTGNEPPGYCPPFMMLQVEDFWQKYNPGPKGKCYSVPIFCRQLFCKSYFSLRYISRHKGPALSAGCNRWVGIVLHIYSILFFIHQNTKSYLGKFGAKVYIFFYIFRCHKL